MNRYRAGGPSKATATTLCQKCLKRGHYSYECTAAQQERPYSSRPSRSQQLLNPKLAPKLTAAVPEAKPIAVKQILASTQDSNGWKPGGDDGEPTWEQNRRRSASTHSSDSVSTISTNKSASRSRSPHSRKLSETNAGNGASGDAQRRRSGSLARRYQPGSSVQAACSDSYRDHRAGSSNSRSRSSSPRRSPRRADGRARSRSRSPFRDTARAVESNTRRRRDAAAAPASSSQRNRSLSPYSRRVAMSRGSRGV